MERHPEYSEAALQNMLCPLWLQHSSEASFQTERLIRPCLSKIWIKLYTNNNYSLILIVWPFALTRSAVCFSESSQRASSHGVDLRLLPSAWSKPDDVKMTVIIWWFHSEAPEGINFLCPPPCCSPQGAHSQSPGGNGETGRTPALQNAPLGIPVWLRGVSSPGGGEWSRGLFKAAACFLHLLCICTPTL